MWVIQLVVRNVEMTVKRCTVMERLTERVKDCSVFIPSHLISSELNCPVQFSSDEMK